MTRPFLVSLFLALAFALPNPGRAEWTMTGGPQQGNIKALLSEGQMLLASVETIGIFRSADGGETWSQVNSGLSGNTFYSLCEAGSYILASGVTGVFRSADKGNTWSLLDGSPKLIRTLVASGNRLFGVGEGGELHVSADGGQHWSDLASRPDSIAVSLVGRGDTLIMGSITGYAYVSRDGGLTWDSSFVIKNGPGGLATRVPCLLIAGDTVFAGSDFGAIYRSTDWGKSWARVFLIPSQPYSIGTFFRQGSAIYVFPAHGMLKSTDGGSTWAGDTTSHSIWGVSTVVAVEGAMVAAKGPELIRSVDGGGTWVRMNPSLYNMGIVAVGVAGKFLFAGQHNGSMTRSGDQGNHWDPIHESGIWDAIRGIKSLDGYVFALTNSMGIFRSSDDGMTWDSMNTGLRNPGRQFIFALDLVIHDGLLFDADGYSGVHRSADSGRHWSQTANGIPYKFATSLITCGSYLLVGLEQQGIYRSADDGESWAPANTLLQMNATVSDYVYGFAISGSVLLTSTAHGVYQSANCGETWSPRNQGLPSSGPVLALAAEGADLFAATSRGIFHTTAGGGDWIPMNQGLNDSGFSNLATDGKYLYTGTSSFGYPDRGAVWRRPLADFALPDAIVRRSVPRADADGGAQGNLVLRAPGTLELRLTRASEVDLGLFDLEGRKIATLAHGPMLAGRQLLMIPGSPSQGNMRIVRLRIGDETRTRPILLRP